MHFQGCNVRSHGLASATGRQASHSTGTFSSVYSKRSSKVRQEMRAFAGVSVVAPFVAATSNTRRSNKQQGNARTVAAAVQSSSEFKETAAYAKGKVQKVSISLWKKKQSPFFRPRPCLLSFLLKPLLLNFLTNSSLCFLLYHNTGPTRACS